jgi:single-stranded-DNA-specific exonuclease
MTGPTRWIHPAALPPGRAEAFASEIGIAPWVAALLLRRGMENREIVHGFLHPRLRALSDPFLLPAMETAAARLLDAIERRRRIVLYGDYDVDGVTSLTLLVRVLRAYRAEVSTFLPRRVDEGYGLSADGVQRCVEERNPELLVAVDCGTTAVAEIAGLKAAGVEVLVLDHHEPGPELPAASAIVNPKLAGDAGYLCSAGIAFKVAHALLKRRPIEGFDLKEVLDLVAIGTVADVVPLVDENRILVRTGLEQLARSRWPGVAALVDVAGLRAPFTPPDLGFGLGPRLNAAGRLDSAEAALELLLTDDQDRAASLARALDQRNRERRLVEDEVLARAEAQITSTYDPGGDAAIVVGGAGWHPGVVGIVASRLQRRYHRPVFVIGFDPMGVGKGSGRSIEGLSLVAALDRCRHLLEKAGGHEMAAGLTIRQERFEEFRAAFTLAAGEMLSAEQLQRSLLLDAELTLGQLDLALLDAHDMLQPFGTDNRQPAFVTRGVSLAGEPRLMKEKHFSFLLRQGRSQCRAVWWNAAASELPRLPWDVAYTVSRNEWNGRVSAQIEVRDIRTAAS